MPVAVLSALQTELDLLIDSVDRPRRTDLADWPVWAGKLGDVDVVLARAGLGKVNTGALAALTWERHRPSLIVFTGVAGGLDPALGVGDVVIGEKTIQHDAGVIGPDGNLYRYQAGHIPFYNPTDVFGFKPSEQLLSAVRAVIPEVELTPVLDRSPSVVFGTILTGDVFLQDEITRDRMFTDLDAQAIEMEGAALGQTANRLGVDHLVIRSLSDLAGRESEAHFDRFVSEVAANSARLVLGVLHRIEQDHRDLTIGT